MTRVRLCPPTYVDSGICTSTACGIVDAMDPPLTYNKPGTSSAPRMLETLDSEHPNKKKEDGTISSRKAAE